MAPRAVLARRGSCSHFAITQREIAAPNRISPHGKFDFLFRCLLRAIRQQQIGRGRGRRNRDKSRMERMFGMGRMAMFGRQLDRSHSWWERTAAMATGSTHWPRATGNWQLATGSWQQMRRQTRHKRSNLTPRELFKPKCETRTCSMCCC